jgi:hypothetical protein
MYHVKKTRKRKTLKRDKLWPLKYYRGLTKKQALARKAEIKKFGSLHWNDPKAYVGFKTDTYAKTKRKSSYTAQWDRLFPEAKSLEERSKVTGVPVKYLKTVYNRGMAAWRTGHRSGMSQQAGPIHALAPTCSVARLTMVLTPIKCVWRKKNRLWRGNGFGGAKRANSPVSNISLLC